MSFDIPLTFSIAIPDSAASRVSMLRASASFRNGRTELDGRYCTSPIKIAKTFPCAPELGVMIMDASPGMLEGDRYVLEWDSGAGAHLSLTNQGFTKIHSCPSGKGTSMHSSYRLASHACIENMMKPIMLYKDASFENDTIVELQRGAVWMQAEILCPGRAARGELFLYKKLDNKLRVFYEDELIHYQRQLILPESQRMDTKGAWENYSHTGTFHVFSDRVSPDLLEKVRQSLAEKAPGLNRQVYAGAALTYRHGLAVMAASYSAWVLQETILKVWEVVRRVLLDLPPSLWGSDHA